MSESQLRALWFHTLSPRVQDPIMEYCEHFEAVYTDESKVIQFANAMLGEGYAGAVCIDISASQRAGGPRGERHHHLENWRVHNRWDLTGCRLRGLSIVDVVNGCIWKSTNSSSTLSTSASLSART